MCFQNFYFESFGCFEVGTFACESGGIGGNCHEPHNEFCLFLVQMKRYIVSEIVGVCIFLMRWKQNLGGDGNNTRSFRDVLLCPPCFVMIPIHCFCNVFVFPRLVKNDAFDTFCLRNRATGVN